jgi:1,4-dihydroxy-2-naphthoyl-CoA hydrolase
VIEELFAAMPLAQHLGIKLVEAGPDEVTLRIEFSESLSTTAGVLHGGVLMSLADTAGALCAFLNLPPESGTSTIESKTNFFRAVRDGYVDAVARPLHIGRSTIVVQTELTDASARRVAMTTQTQAVLSRR